MQEIFITLPAACFSRTIYRPYASESGVEVTLVQLKRLRTGDSTRVRAIAEVVGVQEGNRGRQAFCSVRAYPYMHDSTELTFLLRVHVLNLSI